MTDPVLAQMEMIAVSLYLSPATLDELMTRDFMRNRADYMIDRLLQRLEVKGWIWQDRHGRYHTYRAVAKKELASYDL